MTPATCQRHRTFNGFTGIELLVVLAIAAVMITLAMPSMTNLLQGMRTQGEANALAQDINLARSSALQTGLTTTLCSSRSGTVCDGVDGSWQAGWLVFTDPTSSQTFSADNMLRREQAFSNTDTLQTTPMINSISFNRSGFAINLPANTLLRTATTPDNPDAVRCVVIQATRRATVQSPSRNPGTCQ